MTEVEERPSMEFVVELAKVLIDHAFFSQATFGSDADVGPLGPIKHLHEETREVIEAPTDPVEYVDMMFLVADAVRRFLHQQDMNPYKFVRTARAKLEVLKARDWPAPKDGEPRKHIKAEPALEANTILPGLMLQGLKPERAPDFIIGSEAEPYLLRWWLIPRNPSFNVYYHRVLRDDDDRALHDHPWPSFSVMVSGRLREITEEGSRIIETSGCVYRSPEMAHRLELVDGPAETLFITGPRIRDWGFHCPKGWVHWKDFVAANPGEIGRGCGEV